MDTWNRKQATGGHESHLRQRRCEPQISLFLLLYFLSFLEISPEKCSLSYKWESNNENKVNMKPCNIHL